MGVHLTQLITKCVKASIHGHKLCHDDLESHYLGSRSPQSNLGLAPSHGSSVYGTYNHKIRRFGIGDRKMAKKPHDSRRKNELMNRRIPIDIYKG